MKKYFIHIGLPRTGTTFLQWKVFPFIENHEAYGLPYTHYNHAFQKMMYQDDTLYNPNEFKKEIEALPGENIILSNENFVGQSIFYYHTNRTRTAKRLKEAMPNATIILYLRNQLDLLKSHYLINLSGKETKSAEEFIWTKRNNYTVEEYQKGNYNYGENDAYFSTFASHEHLDSYIFKPLLDLYFDLFDNVEVFLYEEFNSSPKKTIDRLEKIFQTPLPDEVKVSFSKDSSVNQGVNKSQAYWHRKLNNWQPILAGKDGSSGIYRKFKQYIDRSSKKAEKFEFEESLKQKITDFYIPHNEELKKVYPTIGIEEYWDKYSFNQ